MHVRCPNCKTANEGKKGDLVRCKECKKVFEAKRAINYKRELDEEVPELKKQPKLFRNKPPKPPAEPLETKLCTYCAREVDVKAIKCPLCGHLLIQQVDTEEEPSGWLTEIKTKLFKH